MLFHVPALAPVTVTLNVQLLFAASEPVEKDIVPGEVVDIEPPQVEAAPLVATVSPAGSVSVNPMPDSELDLFGLVMVKDNDVVLPVKTEAGEKDLARIGGAITSREAVA